MKKNQLAFLTATISAFFVHGNALAQSDPAGDQWRYTIGAGVMSAPKYPGAGDSSAKGFPVIGATYGRLFLGAADIGVTVPVGIGYNVIQTKNWKAGIAVGYDIYSVRKESDNAEKLRGLGNIERTTRTSIFSRYSNNGFSAFGALINSAKGQGLQIKGGIDFSSQVASSLILNAGPSFTWGNEKSNKTFFGVNETQSANSGKRQYAPSSGFTDVTLSAGATYLLSPAWSIGAKASVSYLPDTATDSPIVEKDVTTSYGIFTAYRF